MIKKTITRTKEEQLLTIWNDEDVESPRSDSNLGYFVNPLDTDHSSPEANRYSDTLETLLDIHETTSEVIERLKEEYDDIEEVFYIDWRNYSSSSPNVYTLPEKQEDQPTHCTAYYIIPKNNELGVTSDHFTEVIKQELEVFKQWQDGEVYGFTLQDENTNTADSCGGFYDLEDIKEHIPEEYKEEDLEEYKI